VTVVPPTVFADRFYWLAVTRPRDPWHAAAIQWTTSHPSTRIVTTDEVFTEYLNAMSSGGQLARTYAISTVRDLRGEPNVLVLPQTRADFDDALALYHARLDKEYSLTDCRSMNAMRGLGLTDVLTNDHHFTQEGFQILFTGSS
jgi:predicted nucleic acid-binding protein